VSRPYRVAVITSDPYLPAIQSLAWLIKRYWKNPPAAIVGGFSPPSFGLPRDWAFHSIGRFEDYPIDRWSDALIGFLEAIPDPIVLLMLEDMWPVQAVKGDIIDAAYEYIYGSPNVARFDLTSDRQFAGGAEVLGELMPGVGLVRSDPNSQYHLSMMPAFWRTSWLLKALRRGETPWQTELSGTPRLAKMKAAHVYGTDALPLKVTLAFRGGDNRALLLNEIDSGVVEQMDKSGLFDWVY